MSAREATLRQYGGSLGTLSAGDKVYIIETEQGILLTPYDPDFVHVMDAEGRISRKYQNALNELAR